MQSATKIDRAISRLESRLREAPDNREAARNILGLLDFHQPGTDNPGRYSECQRLLASKYREVFPAAYLQAPEKIAKHYKEWHSLLVAKGIKARLPISQLFAGQFHTINGAPAKCEIYIPFFKKKAVIPRICHSCFKVQILPADLVALMQLYLVFKTLDLPKDNTRKCMIELREDVSFPYKGYIYGETEEEIIVCKNLLEATLKKHGILNIYCGISHGCSEYGLKYPEFKYSIDGAYRSFKRPESWDRIEAEFLTAPDNPRDWRRDHNNDKITLKDVIGFRTWIDYAEIIGDETFRQFRNMSLNNKPEPFATRVKAQSKMRFEQLAELRDRIAS